MDSRALGLGLLIAGLISLAFSIVSTLVRSVLRGKKPAGLVSTLLALVAAVATIAALFINTFVVTLTPDPLVPASAGGMLAVAMGIIAFLFEKRRKAFRPDASAGLLTAGVGILLLTATLIVPVLPSQFWPVPSMALQTVEPTLLPTLLFSPTPVPASTSSPTPTLTVTPSYTPRPTATPTRLRYTTRTPTPTPAIAPVCSAVVNFNLNLRPSPELNSPVLVVIPHSSIITVGGRSEDAEWWFVEYNDVWGWVSAEYVTAEPGCSTAPVLPQ